MATAVTNRPIDLFPGHLIDIWASVGITVQRSCRGYNHLSAAFSYQIVAAPNSVQASTIQHFPSSDLSEADSQSLKADS
jgi:hypothetical protein